MGHALQFRDLVLEPRMHPTDLGRGKDNNFSLMLRMTLGVKVWEFQRAGRVLETPVPQPPSIGTSE
ncbi:hypothetical protein HAX54_029183, partial [Datura stramonium]|nr:hypothetical protein [Datura stramonium]